MRPTHSVPPNDGSRRSLRCPPSHPLMALPSHLAQASARTARPSGPSTHATSMGRVSPLLHQPGSTTYSPPITTTMEGEYGPTAAPPMPSAQASPPDCLAKGSMAPSPATTEAATPSPSLAHPSTPARSYPSHPHQIMGGILEGSMAPLPLPATTEAAMPSPSSAHPFLPTQSSPTHYLQTMGGSAAWAAGRAMERSTNVWHSPCLHAQDLLIKIHG